MRYKIQIKDNPEGSHPYHKYDVKFSYSSTKSHQRSQRKTDQAEDNFELGSKYFDKHNSYLKLKSRKARIEACKSLPSVTAAKTSFSFFNSQEIDRIKANIKNKQIEWKMPDNHFQVDYKLELKYLKSKFPARKKKTGEQILLKLLIKFLEPENNLKRQSFMQKLKGSQQDDLDQLMKIRPTIKMNARLNWVKTTSRKDSSKQEKPQGTVLFMNQTFKKP